MGHIPQNPPSRGTPYTHGSDANQSSKGDGPHSTVKGKRYTPSQKTPDSDHKDLRKRKIESSDKESGEKSSLLKRAKNAVASSDDGQKKPHKNPYYWAGAAASIAGAAILLTPAAPVGAMLMLMGLIAHTWAYIDSWDDADAANQMANQHKDNIDRTKENQEKEREKDPLGDKTNINNANGRFIAQPVNYKGEKFDFSGKNPDWGKPPPPLNPQYNGPGFQGIYNMATKMGVPGPMANNFMNGCMNFMAGQPAGLLPNNPAQCMSFPLVHDFGRQFARHLQATGQSVPPLTDVVGQAGSLLPGAGLPQPPGPAINIHNTNGAPLDSAQGGGQPQQAEAGKKHISLNLNLSDLFAKGMANRSPEEQKEDVATILQGVKTEAEKTPANDMQDEIKRKRETLEELDRMLEKLRS